VNFMRLSPAAQGLLAKAADESTKREHHFLGVEHLFLALGRSENTPLQKALAGQNFHLGQFADKLGGSIEVVSHRPWGSEMLFTPRCRDVLELALTRSCLTRRM